MQTVMVLIGLLLAVARLTRLVTIDRVTLPVRDRIVQRFGADSQIAYLFHCPWCMSPWIAAVLTAITWWLTPLGDSTDLPAWWAVPAIILSVGHIVGLLQRAEAAD